MPTREVQTYLENIEKDAQNNGRYNWLLSYLRRDPKFINERLHPVGLGRTHTTIVDFFLDPATPVSISNFQNSENIENTLTTRPDSVVVRLILVVGISGVDEQSRLQQTSGIIVTAVPPSEDQDYRAPILTRSRTARVRDTHPIRGHVSYLPEPEALSYVAAATRLDSEILLRHLDQQEHLVYRRQLQSPRREKGARSREQWFNTIILLVNEDNCLGIDFNPYASEHDQVFQSSPAPPNEAFETILRSKDEYERALVLENPLSLAWDYVTIISNTFASQLELYRRKWKILYEKHANTTAVYGNPEIRGIIRKEATQLSTHIQYIKRSLQRLEKITPKTRRKSSPPTGSVLDELIQDFQHMSDQLENLKSAYDNFIGQQLGKVSLAEARESMTEARDLQRLSYLGFVFAPLSLACSFFSTDIQPLDGPAPVWQLAVTSLAILFFSLLVLYLLIAWSNNRPKLSFPPAFLKRNQGCNLPQVNRVEKAHPLAESPSNGEVLVGKSVVTDQTVREPTGSDEQTAHARNVSKGAETTVTQTTRIQASQGAKPRIPMNDSERRWPYLEELNPAYPKVLNLDWTAAHQPPPREEFTDSPKVNFSSVGNPMSTQYPIQHRPARKRPEVAVTATTEVAPIFSNAEKSSHFAETSGTNTDTTNLVASGEGITAIVTTRVEYGHGVEETAEDEQTFNRQDDSPHENKIARESWPLRKALGGNHMGIARLPLKKGAHGTDPEVVRAAAESGSIDILEAHVAAGGALVDLDGKLRNSYFTDPFCLAAQGGHLHVMKYILKFGISLDEKLGEQTRGIHAFNTAVQGARQDSEAICLMLLDLGVKPWFSRAQHSEGYSIAHSSYTFAALGGRTTLLKRILDSGADPNAVVRTSGADADSLDLISETVNYLLAVGNGINFAGCPYVSMLAVACAADRLDAALLLIQRGANVHYGSNTKTTPLHIAARNDRVNALKLLLNYEAKIDARAPESRAMPIHDAAGAGSTACIEYLLHYGAALESRDSIGQTPLIVAAREGKLEAVEKLLDEGASVSASDGDGWTAAHRAAWNGHERIVNFLFTRDADLEAETDSGLKVKELLIYAEEQRGDDYR
ncbi:ankyrin repeat-containing domain protein [Xylaria arbuscula]|nr:ankyrin repeat-containing domain protein [Xylaria arbuscula]